MAKIVMVGNGSIVAEPPVLGLMRIVMEIFDDMVKSVEQAKASQEEYKLRLQSFQDIKESQEESIKQILTNLPPERSTPLVMAMMGLTKLMTETGDLKEQVDKFENAIESVNSIRTNLHAALDYGDAS